jgi:Zn-finger nucleic acid-binding protein
MNCPKCNIDMLITANKDIEIDYCPSCYGEWLDKGVLEKIIEKVGDYYSNKKNYETDYEDYIYGDTEYAIHHPNRIKKSVLIHFFDYK